MRNDDYFSPSNKERMARIAELRKFDALNERALLAVWSVVTGKPQSYLDMGCGTGAMVDFARGCGIDTVGLDIIAALPNLRADLRSEVRLFETTERKKLKQFDLITSIEVAEHLPEESADIFCGNIERHLSNDGWLVFTAGIPGQQGDNHINCQPPIYWRRKFWDRSINYQPEFTRALMFMWSLSNVTGPLMHLSANVQVFHKEA